MAARKRLGFHHRLAVPPWISYFIKSKEARTHLYPSPHPSPSRAVRTNEVMPNNFVHYSEIAPRPGFLKSWERHRHRKAHWFVQCVAEAVSRSHFSGCLRAC